jgi:hypothetical protein
MRSQSKAKPARVDIPAADPPFLAAPRRSSQSQELVWRKVLKRGSVDEIKRMLAENEGLARISIEGTGGCMGLHVVSTYQYSEAAVLLM